MFTAPGGGSDTEVLKTLLSAILSLQISASLSTGHADRLSVAGTLFFQQMTYRDVDSGSCFMQDNSGITTQLGMCSWFDGQLAW